MSKVDRALELRPIVEKAVSGQELSDAEKEQATSLFPTWSGDGIAYYDGRDNEHRQSYVTYDGLLYKCVQTHTSQADWTPVAAVSLWARTSDPAEEWPEWIRPTGAHDAYPLNAKVSHNGKHWINTGKDMNEYEPGVWGWDEVV